MLTDGQTTDDRRLFGLMKLSLKLARVLKPRDHFIKARSELPHLVGAVCRRNTETEITCGDTPRCVRQIFNRARELPD